MSSIRPETPPKHPGMFILHKPHPICIPLFRRLTEKPGELESIVFIPHVDSFTAIQPRMPNSRVANGSKMIKSVQYLPFLAFLWLIIIVTIVIYSIYYINMYQCYWENAKQLHYRKANIMTFNIKLTSNIVNANKDLVK